MKLDLFNNKQNQRIIAALIFVLSIVSIIVTFHETEIVDGKETIMITAPGELIIVPILLPITFLVVVNLVPKIINRKKEKLLINLSRAQSECKELSRLKEKVEKKNLAELSQDSVVLNGEIIANDKEQSIEEIRESVKEYYNSIEKLCLEKEQYIRGEHANWYFSSKRKEKVYTYIRQIELLDKKIEIVDSLYTFLHSYQARVELELKLCAYPRECARIGRTPDSNVELLIDNYDWKMRDAIERSYSKAKKEIKVTYRNSQRNQIGTYNQFRSELSLVEDDFTPETKKFAYDYLARLSSEAKISDYSSSKKSYHKISSEMEKIDSMEGHDFERWCASLLIANNFDSAEVTQGSGDQGVDIVAQKDGIRYAIQCKCYSSDLGNTPVQEVYTGKKIYNCHVAVVMTNRYFTAGAKEAADASGVLLWDRDYIQSLITKSIPLEEVNVEEINVEEVSLKRTLPDDLDELFAEAGFFVIDGGKASIGSLQRHFGIGFNRAARIMDQLSDYKIIGPDEGTKPRKIYYLHNQFEELIETISK